VGKDRAQRLVQVINKIPLIGGLGPSQVQAVLGTCKSMRFEEGDVLSLPTRPRRSCSFCSPARSESMQKTTRSWMSCRRNPSTFGRRDTQICQRISV